MEQIDALHVLFNLSTICYHWNLMWIELASGGQIDFMSLRNCKSIHWEIINSSRWQQTNGTPCTHDENLPAVC